MRRLAFLASLLAAACIPADGSLPLGSAQFTVKASANSMDLRGVPTGDSFRLFFDRVVLGFRTMTIGKVGDNDRCAFRGRGETSDVVFDPRARLVQTFNGIAPANCEDVGVFLSPPGDTTDVGPGATSADLIELAQGDPAHAIIDVTARRDEETFVLHFRFDTFRTASRFGGCAGRFEAKGIRVKANERTPSTVSFAPENMFQDSLGFGGTLRVDAFIEADTFGNQDGNFTMDEAERLPLSHLRAFGTYQMPDGTGNGSFADFLRALFRFTFFFKEQGTCVGNEPGTE